MSWNVYMRDAKTGDIVELETPHQFRGGIYQVGGSRSAELNVTYNYGPLLREAWGASRSLSVLDDLTVAEAVPNLAHVIAKYGVHRDEDYWAATPGNVGAAMLDLLNLCALVPADSTVSVD